MPLLCITNAIVPEIGKFICIMAGANGMPLPQLEIHIK
jgi:membrane protein YqaA with SNARE-associated domain